MLAERKKYHVLEFTKRRKELYFLFVLFFFLPEKQFTVEIFPAPHIFVHIGDSVTLTCGVTGCESPSFSWSTQIEGSLDGQGNDERTKSTLTLSPVSLEDENSYLCSVTCGSKKVEKAIMVDLYCKWCSELFIA